MKEAYARGIKSGCAVPLLFHDKIVGAMTVASLRESAFTEDDADLLAQIGTQVAIAVNNALNYERLKIAESEVARERDRTKLLLEINNAVVSHLDLRTLLRSISTSLRDIIPHDGASIILLEPGGQLRLHALDLQALNESSFKEGVVTSAEGTPEGEALASGRSVLVPRLDLKRFYNPWVQKAAESGIRSGCAVPLIAHGLTLGAVSVVSRAREGAFTSEHAKLLEECSRQMAIAVENALNYEAARSAEREAKEERDRSHLLLDVNNAVVAHLDLSQVLKSISASLQRVMANDHAFIALCTPGDTQLQVQALDMGRLQNVAFAKGMLIPKEGTPEEQAIATGQPVVSSSVTDLMRFSSPWVRYAVEHGVKSGCFVPLIAHENTLGVLGVVSLREDTFDNDDVKLLGQISGQVAIAVENALNFEKTRVAEQMAKHERDRSRLLLDINNALVSHLDLTELVRAISNSLQSVVPNECVALAIYDSDTDKLFAQAVSSVISPMPEGIYYDPEGTTSGLVFKSGKPLYLPRPDYESFSSPVTHGFYKSGLKSLYSMPIGIHGRKLGVLSISSIREDAFTEDDQELFQQIANQVAIAAANALSVRDLEALKNKLAQEKLYLEDEIRNELNFDEIVGQSPALKQVLKLVKTVSASDSTVLLLGETGTGKELIARAVHEHSRRKSRTFVKLNCAAIPTGLLESELFGHEKGAFTGAIAQKIGRLELADQGTLFLDEVGDIPIEIQPKLLRALQEREFERLGSTHTKKVNVRLVAATNRDLEKMIEERQFRGDLYYRLNVFPIQIPPLRERQEDIPLLVRYFAEKFARQMQKPIDSIPTETMGKLRRWRWPGNVRELENLIERAVILTTGTALQVPLPEIKPTSFSVSTVPSSRPDENGDREHIIKILRETGGMLGGPNGAAARLGIKRTTLQYKIKKLGITRNQWWPPSLQA